MAIHDLTKKTRASTGQKITLLGPADNTMRVTKLENRINNQEEKLDKILQPLHHAMFVESNPSPVKFAAKQLGLCNDDVRLPLVKVTEQTKEIINKALQSAKLIK